MSVTLDETTRTTSTFMAKQFPSDRFDDVPDDLARVGAHRAEPRSGWIAFAWAALATGILVTGGVIGLALFTDSINIDLPFAEPTMEPTTEPTTEPAPAPSPSPSPSETVEPTLDPTVPITVLNGTTTAGLANAVGDNLVAEGWAGVGTRANAVSNDVESTVVFYADPASEAAALALAQSLGTGEVRLSTDYPQSPIVVLIGTDFELPAG